MPTAFVAFIAALTLLLTVIGPASASSPVAPSPYSSVLLDGATSDIETATRYHCHDITVSTLTCFGSAADRDSDADVIQQRDVLTSDSLNSVATSSSGYVIAWEFIGYAGGSVLLSRSYDNLTSIGWNDKISSFKVYTTLSGAFYEHAYYSGQSRLFCCNAQVSSVGSLDNTFSSFYLP